MTFWHDFVLLFFAMFFGTRALAIVLQHMQKMATIKSTAKDRHAEEVQRRLDELSMQIAEIRQMHTDHVMSIDSHIQHLDVKLAALESKVAQIEQTQSVGR